MKKEKTHPCLLSVTIPSTQLLEPSLLLFPQIRELLNLSLVQAIDNNIFPLLNMYALDLD